MSGLLLGAYGPDMGGGARGIAPVRAAADGSLSIGSVVLECDSPSWLAVRGDRLVATLEGTGELAWFRRFGDGWLADGVVETGGQNPCHVAFLDDDTVAVACYGDGAVVLLRHGEDAAIQRLEGAGSGPLPAQEGPHAHHVHVLPDGRVLTLDLGADRLHVHRRSDDGLLERVSSLALPEGTGPRDLLALPSGELALLGEWSCELFVIDPAGDEFEVVQILALPGATQGCDQAAALGLSADGRFLYAGIRGANRIAVVALEADGARALEAVPSGGSWPRHLLVVGEVLYVANQLSDQLSTFRLDAHGLPRPLSATTAPAPTCIVVDAG